ncbi:lysophospholipase [Novosphingobium sp. AAP83]|uniref:alpha/beta hydrolase family protein n=1 Tax=Novosphingobium sp. AAP83 TaxID=1523425 RepID=UPI0006B889A5|nr:lysophospholipase [Novosphingobium sp. AAP83]KPF90830.1 lysophospholipase [Novosphingobium sp. AAP83]
MKMSRRDMLAGSGALLAASQAGAMASAPVVERQFTLAGPDGREVRISEWKPRGKAKAQILFSHGAASSPRFYEGVFAPWAAAGFQILAPLHVDSVEHPRTKDFPGLASWKARIEDMRVLSAYVGQRPWIAAGHSYGGLVALTMGGAAAVVPEGLSGPLSDPNVRAVVAFSPPAPIPALCTAQGYAALAVPALVQTGTKDIVPGITATNGEGWRGHLMPFEAAAAGSHRYGLVLDGVDHYFGGAICRYDLPGPKQVEQLADAARISTLFVDAFGRADRRARVKLDGLVRDELPVRLMRK